MCKLCNGKGVIHEDEGYYLAFHPCPNCPGDTRSMEVKYPELMAKVAQWKKETA